MDHQHRPRMRIRIDRGYELPFIFKPRYVQVRALWLAPILSTEPGCNNISWACCLNEDMRRLKGDDGVVEYIESVAIQVKYYLTLEGKGFKPLKGLRPAPNFIVQAGWEGLREAGETMRLSISQPIRPKPGDMVTLYDGDGNEIGRYEVAMSLRGKRMRIRIDRGMDLCIPLRCPEYPYRLKIAAHHQNCTAHTSDVPYYCFIETKRVKHRSEGPILVRPILRKH